MGGGPSPGRDRCEDQFLVSRGRRWGERNAFAFCGDCQSNPDHPDQIPDGLLGTALPKAANGVSEPVQATRVDVVLEVAQCRLSLNEKRCGGCIRFDCC